MISKLYQNSIHQFHNGGIVSSKCNRLSDVSLLLVDRPIFGPTPFLSDVVAFLHQPHTPRQLPQVGADPIDDDLSEVMTPFPPDAIVKEDLVVMERS